MRLLVTGATGLLGNNVVRLAQERNIPTRVLVRGDKPRRELEGLDVEIHNGDVCDQAAVAAAMQGIDAVVHSAALVHIGWTRGEEMEKVNVDATRIVAQAAREAGARMVHVSSVDALGLGKLAAPANEENALPGITPCPYPTTKAAAEKVVREEIEGGLDACIVNPCLMFAPWDWKPSSGRMLLEVGTRYTPVAPAGECNVCDARDVADGTLAAVEKGAVGRNYILGAYNMTYLDAWKKMAEITGSSSPFMAVKAPGRILGGFFGDTWGKITGTEPALNSAAVSMSTESHCFDSSRAMEELGYQIRPFDETLQDTWAWFREHGFA